MDPGRVRLGKKMDRLEEYTSLVSLWTVFLWMPHAFSVVKEMLHVTQRKLWVLMVCFSKSPLVVVTISQCSHENLCFSPTCISTSFFPEKDSSQWGHRLLLWIVDLVCSSSMCCFKSSSLENTEVRVGQCWQICSWLFLMCSSKLVLLVKLMLQSLHWILCSISLCWLRSWSLRRRYSVNLDFLDWNMH